MNARYRNSTVEQHGQAALAQHAGEQDPYFVANLDGACRELNVRGVGLALLYVPETRAVTVVERAEPIPFHLSTH